ncbi:Guanine nucleotide-binding protein alpha-2 subunit [Tulasnella sp. 408]|nr:Guanine nucleotide-binding protein alpha-2 subunit [Tulasnella sp. 408]
MHIPVQLGSRLTASRHPHRAPHRPSLHSPTTTNPGNQTPLLPAFHSTPPTPPLYANTPANTTHTTEILEYQVESDPSTRLAPDIANAIDSPWKDPIIATFMDHSSEFYFMDSASYFFSQAQRIAQREYVPNESDVLRARAKTTGISETRFNMDQLSIHMFDVGGHRSEPVTSITFCVALSEYDQVLLEGKKQGRMAESLVLFESLINARWLLRTSIILFPNKIDVFKAKLPKVPLEPYFPEYTGGPDINKAAKYICGGLRRRIGRG